MPLRIHVSNRLEILLDRLAAELAAAPLGPLEREVVVVQSRGMYRWVTLELARRLGIAATLATPFPGTFFRALAERVEGHVTAPSERYEPVERSPYDRNALTWRIFGLLGSGDHAVVGPAAAYVERDADHRKRYQLAARLAERFDEYQLYRPDVLAAWERGKQPITDPRAAEVAQWQAALWRALVEAIAAGGSGRNEARARPSRGRRAAGGVPARALSPARRFAGLVDRLESDAGTGVAELLPKRVQVFGASALPPLFVRMLGALARHVGVSLYVVEPTHESWGDIRSARVISKQLDFFRERGIDEAAAHAEVGNPLLAAFGRQGRELHRALQDLDETGSAREELPFVVPERTTVLATLQADVAELIERVPRAAERIPSHAGTAVQRPASLPLPQDDRSLEVHVCHSPMREMEVLRDLLLDAFAQDAALRPHDVLVLLPDVSRYAPYVEAAFGAVAPGEPVVPFTIADRSARHTQPPVQAAMRMLELVGGRTTAGDVLDLLDVAAVCRAARIEAAEVAMLRAWVREANIRWGIDGRHRRDELGLPCDEFDTWRAGLDRLLLGYAIAEHDVIVAASRSTSARGECDVADAASVSSTAVEAGGGGSETAVSSADTGLATAIVPQPLAAAAAADLLGRFTAWADALLATLRALRAPRGLEAWANDLRGALDAFVAPADEVEEQALRSLREHVSALADAAEQSGARESVELEAVRTHLRDVLEADAGGAGFLSGAVTFCSLKPMRAIPAKIICIAGLDDGAFPRSDRRPSFDLIAAGRRDGDRSPRDEDRYAFLETLLAARERLLLTYVGRSHKDNSERAPSSVLAELFETIDRTFAPASAAEDRVVAAHVRLTVVHPLQPFSARYFRGTGVPGRLFSYSRNNAAAAEAASAAREAPVRDAPFCPRPLAAGDGQRLEIALLDLCDFWVNPSKHFCRNVLGIRLPRDAEDDLEDDERFTIAALDGYGLLDRMLARRLDGVAAGEAELAWLRAAGRLPHAGFARAHYEISRKEVEAMCAAVTAAAGGTVRALRTLAVDVEGDDWRVVGLIDGVAPRRHVRWRPAGLAAKDKLRAWVTHVALNAWARQQGSSGGTTDDVPRETVVVGREESVRLRPLDDAREVLATLVAGYRDGCRRPLPVFTTASCAYAEAKHGAEAGKSVDPLARAREKFNGGMRGAGQRIRGDVDDPYVALCTRDRNPFEHDREEMERLALELWRPILGATEPIER